MQLDRTKLHQDAMKQIPHPGPFCVVVSLSGVDRRFDASNIDFVLEAAMASCVGLNHIFLGKSYPS